MKMKKIFCGLLAAVMMTAVLCPVTAFAAEKEEPAGVIITPVEMTREEFEQMEYVEGENNFESSPMLRASGLITQTKLDMAKAASNKITVYATTGCIPEVSKCGFTKIIVQRRLNSSQSWSNYITYDDLYSSSSYYNSGFTVMVTTGYQYRLTGVHYAYRNIFSTQKIDNSTSYIQF